MRSPDRSVAGTRFRLYPQLPLLRPGRPPETVIIRSPPGTIGPGPSDDRLYVIDPVGKRGPYGLRISPYGTPILDLPPWRGLIAEPAAPDRTGHFDWIDIGAPGFMTAHLYAVIRFVLDVWEHTFGHPVPWHFARDFNRLEVTLLPSFNNAHVGWGFMEVGAKHFDDGAIVPHALNFDVIAHELGHLMIYSTLGVPNPWTLSAEYFGFQESAADMVAIIAALHFNSMLDDLLIETRGNLYTFNELNRFAELSSTEQIRLASNSVKLSEFVAGWENEHELSQPLTGALFDTLVDIFQEGLVARGLIRREIADLSDEVRRRPQYAGPIQSAFDASYPGNHHEFKAALIEARDYLGLLLAETWKRLSPVFLSYPAIGAELIAVDSALSGGRHRDEIADSFNWREIGRVAVGPRLQPPDETSHIFSARSIVPIAPSIAPRLSYREQVLFARGR